MPGYRDNGTLVEETGAGILARDDAETLLRASPVHAGGGVINSREGRGAAGQSRDGGGLVYLVKSGSRRRCRDAILLCRDRGLCWWDEFGMNPGMNTRGRCGGAGTRWDSRRRQKSKFSL